MMDIAFGQGGDVMIELIKPLGEWPNVYGEAPPRQGAVVPHHHGHLVADMDAAEALLGGVTPVTTGTLGATAALRYYDMRETLGVFIETISDTEDARAFFALARDAARDWDGVEQPLRTMVPPNE